VERSSTSWRARSRRARLREKECGARSAPQAESSELYTAAGMNFALMQNLSEPICPPCLKCLALSGQSQIMAEPTRGELAGLNYSRGEMVRVPRVLLADDHSKMRDTVAQLLKSECEIVGSVENGKQLIDAAFNLDPDVIVLDISMPVLNGIEAARHLKKSGSRAKVIFLTMHADDELVAAAVQAGALGYVLKSRVVRDLLTAIREVRQGHTFASPPLRI
jgi:CheY-like chemotaxis protein